MFEVARAASAGAQQQPVQCLFGLEQDNSDAMKLGIPSMLKDAFAMQSKDGLTAARV